VENTIVVNPRNIPKHELESLCRPLVGTIEKFYRNPANVDKFEQWHVGKYGCPPSNIDALRATLTI
jgi:hypothetical protein